MANNLTIKEVSQRTGLAASTIRMWEHRYGFPAPARTDSGYRHYTDEEIAQIKSVIAYRDRGLSLPVAVERVMMSDTPAEPSIYAAVATADGAPVPQVLRKTTLHALSRAMEHEAVAQGTAAICFGSFQHESFYRPVENRYAQIARSSDATVVFADFAKMSDNGPGKPIEVPIKAEDALGNEWTVIIDSPGYAACLIGWEQPQASSNASETKFEAIWTVEPKVVRRASEVAARLAGRHDAALGERLQQMLSDRPLASTDNTQSLTNLTNRIVKYVEVA
ncbi:MAG: MerR family transcriptional regulator [Solirubrobacterales bacterium]|nr:MerR family transcriptional regulator [Solirubrobacterales bacterium]